MPIKKLNEADVRRSLGPLAQTGRRPTTPRRTEARLDQLIKESTAWLRLFREVWFYPVSGILELAVGASDDPDLPERYDEAIEQMRWIAASAQYGEARLREGKQRAIAKLEPRKSTTASTSQSKNTDGTN